MSDSVVNYADAERRYPSDPIPPAARVLSALVLLPFLLGFVILHGFSPSVLRESYSLWAIPKFGWDYRAAWPMHLLALFAVTCGWIVIFRAGLYGRVLRVGLLLGAGVSLYYLPSLLVEFAATEYDHSPWPARIVTPIAWVLALLPAWIAYRAGRQTLLSRSRALPFAGALLLALGIALGPPALLRPDQNGLVLLPGGILFFREAMPAQIDAGEVFHGLE